MIDLYTRVPVMGVRVLLGYGFSNPYPNPSKTRHFTPGFPLPAPIPSEVESQFRTSAATLVLLFRTCSPQYGTVYNYLYTVLT
jgi:hypothetical protein